MESFVEKHAGRITGSIGCFDRVLFKGHLPLNQPGAMERLLHENGTLIRDFNSFVKRYSARIQDAGRAAAATAGRPYRPVAPRVRKEDLATDIAGRDGIADGLVCILTAVEACGSFKVVPGEGRPRIVPARRKCLCLYYYLIDRRFGMIHVRIATWFPFTVQVCLNGHEFLARQMREAGVGFRQCENAFLSIDDGPRAQELSDQFVRQDWPAILSTFAARVNPLLGNLLDGIRYYWVTEQAEFATDVMFKDRSTLRPLYEKLIEHALVCFSAEDVMTFLGRKLHSAFAGELVNDMKKRWPGARIKHRMKENWIKMYDKHGMVLRVETVINHPYEFKVRRRGLRRGRVVTDWFPMAKGVANLYRYAEVAASANGRYLAALSTVPHPGQARQVIRDLGRPIRSGARTHRAFNPLQPKDVALFRAVLRGENAIRGFTNADIRRQLFGDPDNDKVRRRYGARTSRLLGLLHAHGLIARIPRTRRWRATVNGHALMSTVLQLHAVDYPETLQQKVA